MADIAEKWEDNTDGPWYVDKQCILCSVCEQVAPDSFKVSDDGDHDVVHHQPESEEEIAAAMDAMSQCPVEAIGNDGSA